jgi:hypothetical protein
MVIRDYPVATSQFMQLIKAFASSPLLIAGETVDDFWKKNASSIPL